MSRQRATSTHQSTDDEDDQACMLPGSDDDCGISHDVPEEEDDGVPQADLAGAENEEGLSGRYQSRMTWVMKMYDAWVTDHNSRVGDEESSDNKFMRITKPLHEMPDNELNYWLSKFVCEARMHDGREYKPHTLNYIRYGLQSYLKVKTKTRAHLLTDPKYSVFKRNFQAEFQRLSRKNRSSRTSRAKTFSLKDEELLWSHGILGSHAPQVLQQTMVFLNRKNFGLKGGKEHRSLKRSDVSFVTINGMEYLRYFRAGCPPGKNSKGASPGEIFVPPNLDKPERCHVRLCKLYFSKRPECHEGRDYFYASLARVAPVYISDPWYAGLPVGHNTFTKMIADLCDKAKSLRSEQTPDGASTADAKSRLCSITPWDGSAEPTPASAEEYSNPVVKTELIEMDYDININDLESCAAPEAAESSILGMDEASSNLASDAAESSNLGMEEADASNLGSEAAESANLASEIAAGSANLASEAGESSNSASEAAESSNVTDTGVQCELIQTQGMHLLNHLMNGASDASTVYYMNNCRVTINNNQMQPCQRPA